MFSFVIHHLSQKVQSRDPYRAAFHTISISTSSLRKFPLRRTLSFDMLHVRTSLSRGRGDRQPTDSSAAILLRPILNLDPGPRPAYLTCIRLAFASPHSSPARRSVLPLLAVGFRADFIGAVSLCPSSTICFRAGVVWRNIDILASACLPHGQLRTVPAASQSSTSAPDSS